MEKWGVYFFLILFTGVVSFAEEDSIVVKDFNPGTETPLKLRDAIKMATKSNASLKAAALTLESSQNTFIAARYNYYYPSFILAATQNQTKTNNTLTTVSETTDSLNSAIALGGTIPWLGLQYTLTPASQTQTKNNLTGDAYSGLWRAELTMPLLKGLGPYSASPAFEQAALTLTIAKLAKNSSYVSILNEIRTTYWDLLFAFESLKIQKSTTNDAATLVDETRFKIKKGVAAPLEEDGVLANYYLAETAYIKSEQDLIAAQEKFKRLLGLDEKDRSTWLTPDDDEALKDMVPVESDFDKLYEQALKKRPDYVSALKALDSAQRAVTVASNSRWPTLNLRASTSGQSADATDNSSSLSKAYQNQKTENVVGVTFSFAFPNEEALAAHRNAILESAQKEISLQLLRDQIRQTLQTVIYSIDTTRRRIKAAQLAATSSKRKLSNEISKYRMGQTPQRSVIDAQKDFQQARLSEIESLVSYRKAVIEMDTALGQTRVP